MNSPVEEIKNRLDILEVVGGYVKLQKAGGNWRGLCPFHEEKTPSFFVSPSRQMWHCFGGCGTGGDIFAFVMRIEGVEFGDALRQLAQKAGVELRPPDPAFAKLQTERARLLELAEWAAKFFEHQLSSQTGAEVLAYLQGRGVKEETIKAWRLGYAPDTARGLLDFLKSKGFREDEAGRAGLSAFSEGAVFDRFRGRIMFPICDSQGQVIGFGGRIFGRKEGQGLAKYVNTPNTPLYEKSSTLYGLDKAKVAIRKQDECVLVEGYMDAIMVWQSGCANAVASSGTALTPSQLRILKRHTGNLLLAYDMDLAGDAATKRGIDLAISQGFSLKVVIMPQGKDPADIASAGEEIWKQIVQGAVPIIDYYFRTALESNDKQTPEGKKRIAASLLPVFKKIPNAIEQSHWVQRLAQEMGAREEVIREELEKIKDDAPSFAGVSKETFQREPKTRKQLLEEKLLCGVLKGQEHLALLTEEHMPFLSLQTREIVSGLNMHPELSANGWNSVFSSEIAEFLNVLSLRSEIEEPEEMDWKKEIAICLQELKGIYIRNELNRINAEIKQAEAAGDQQNIDALKQEFHALSRQFEQR